MRHDVADRRHRLTLRAGIIMPIVVLMLALTACAPSPDENVQILDPQERVNFVAPRFSEALTIDGDLDDWPIPYLAAMASTADLYRESGTGWEDRPDHAVWLWAGWDDDYLYLAFQRADNRLRYDIVRDIEDAEDQDAILLYMGQKESEENTVFRFTTIDGEAMVDVEGVEYAVTSSQALGPEGNLAGEIHELAIPLALLPVTPAEGVRMRLLPVSVDVDEENGMKTILTWRGASPDALTKYGILEFGGAPEP